MFFYFYMSVRLASLLSLRKAVNPSRKSQEEKYIEGERERDRTQIWGGGYYCMNIDNNGSTGH